jgi:hypothetical protein
MFHLITLGILQFVKKRDPILNMIFMFTHIWFSLCIFIIDTRWWFFAAETSCMFEIKKQNNKKFKVC